MRGALAPWQSVSLFKGNTDSFTLRAQNDKPFSYCKYRGVYGKPTSCHCEGAGVRWTPLRSRSTDRAGRRDAKRLWQSVSLLRGITDSFALRTQNDKRFSCCKYRGVYGKLPSCHCEGAKRLRQSAPPVIARGFSPVAIRFSF